MKRQPKDFLNLHGQNKLQVKEESPIIIAGSKRGGTTLLRRIINAHSMVTIPPPDWLYHFIYPHLYSYGDLERDRNILELIKDCLDIPVIKKYWNIQATPEDLLASVPERSFAGVLTTIVRVYSQQYQKPLWGLKTPGNVFWLKEIQDDFPEARFIFIYRDGRDVGVDLAEVSWGPTNLYTACLLWKSYTQAMILSRELLKPGNFYEIYYEQLVGEPEKTVQGICRFLKLNYEPGMLRYYDQDSDAFMKHGYHLKTGEPITTRYVGLYRNLSLPDRRLQVEAIGETLRTLGYAVEDELREIGFWERERYLEEDRHGGMVLEGAIEFKNMLKNKRSERYDNKIWSDVDKFRFSQNPDSRSAERK